MVILKSICCSNGKGVAILCSVIQNSSSVSRIRFVLSKKNFCTCYMDRFRNFMAEIMFVKYRSITNSWIGNTKAYDKWVGNLVGPKEQAARILSAKDKRATISEVFLATTFICILLLWSVSFLIILIMQVEYARVKVVQQMEMAVGVPTYF